jgi:hypothetical protein
MIGCSSDDNAFLQLLDKLADLRHRDGVFGNRNSLRGHTHPRLQWRLYGRSPSRFFFCGRQSAAGLGWKRAIKR